MYSPRGEGLSFSTSICLSVSLCTRTCKSMTSLDERRWRRSETCVGTNQQIRNIFISPLCSSPLPPPCNSVPIQYRRRTGKFIRRQGIRCEGCGRRGPSHPAGLNEINLKWWRGRGDGNCRMQQINNTKRNQTKRNKTNHQENSKVCFFF